jgi:hypothetical protein
MARSEEAVARQLRDVAARMIEASKLLAAKPERSLIGDASRAQKDTHQAGLALVQQSRALHLFDVLDAKQTEATACVADLDKKAAVYVTCAKLFLSCCSAAPRKLAAKPCADVLRVTSQLCTNTATRAASAPHVARLEAAVEAVAKLSWRADVAVASLLLESEGLLRDALAELKEAAGEVGPSAFAGSGEEGSEEEDDTCELLQHGPLTSAACELLSLAVDLTVAGRACLTASSWGSAVDGDWADQMAGTLMTCASAATAQVDALVSALAHEGDADQVCSHAGSLGKILCRMLTTVDKLAGAAGEAATGPRVGANLQDVVARCVAAAREAELAAPAEALSGAEHCVGELAGELRQVAL